MDFLVVCDDLDEFAGIGDMMIPFVMSLGRSTQSITADLSTLRSMFSMANYEVDIL